MKLITRAYLIIFLLLPIASMSAESILENDKRIYLLDMTYELSVHSSFVGDSILFTKQEKSVPIVQFAVPIKRDTTTAMAEVAVRFPKSGYWHVSLAGSEATEEFWVVPGWLSLFPPLIAIMLALITRQVLIALFAGIWFGGTVIFGYNPFLGFLESLTTYIGQAPADPERIAILIFSLTLGGMVGVISKSGGTQGIIERLTRYASSPRSGQLATWVMGILVFFDDYANTLIVGNTMRPLTDRLRISREKLAYLVDSTAAPVATIAIISTWIGYQLSLIAESFRKIGLDENAYITFFKTIPYNFYPILALIFGFLIAISRRDFFSMYRAEKRATEKGALMRDGAIPLSDLSSEEIAPKKGAPHRWYNALVPIIVVIVTTLGGLWFTGLEAAGSKLDINEGKNFLQYLSFVIGQSNSFDVLMWAAFMGAFTAIILAVFQRILTLGEAIMAWVGGVKAMVIAALILTLAWSIGNICSDIQTADYVIMLTKDLLSPHYLPLLSFLIAGIIAFSTGTSWGTMAILTPIVIPLAHQLPLSDPFISETARQGIFLSSIASILAGATFGDHCSPISDTTIMSSMASGADHIDHVRTQLPYALIVAAVSILFGYLPAGFGFNPLISLGIGLVFLVTLIRMLGKPV